MKKQFTPGPWYEASTGNHQGLIISETTGANVAAAYNKKDACLIAAAPDLLEALEWLNEELGDLDMPSHPSVDATQNARAAIQKALNI